MRERGGRGAGCKVRVSVKDSGSRISFHFLCISLLEINPLCMLKERIP
jgi:hypothetical protein